MGHHTDEISIHAKKYFRVILEGINADAETPESFALKLTARMRVSLPRVKSLIGRLPCTVKEHLTAAQANRLKDLLETLGGRVRIEAHLVTPAGAEPVWERQPGRSRLSHAEDRNFTCPECGWEAEKGATHCSFCLRKFRDPAARPVSLEDRVPEKNPLDADWDPSATRTRRAWGGVSGYLLLVLLGVAAVLAVVFLTK